MRDIILIIFLGLCFNIQAQKKELRKIDKLVTESFFKEANSELQNFKSLILSSEDKYKAQFYFYDAKVSNEIDEYENAIKSLNELNKLNPTSNLPSKLQIDYSNLSLIIANDIVNAAIKDNQEENYLEGAKKLIMAYEMDKEEYIDYLYFAAGSAVNGRDYDLSLEYYLKLKNMNYTGIVDEYYITNVESGVEEKVANQTEYELLKNSNDHTNPRIGQTQSRFPEIVKNIALIYLQQDKIDLAKEAIREAREVQPNDVTLLLNEADLFIRLSNAAKNDEEMLIYRNKFKESMKIAIEIEPENGILYYNLGVISSRENEVDDAENYYLKAISFKPDYTDAYLNLYNIYKGKDEAITQQMDKLGFSKEDTKRYEEFKNLRQIEWKKVLPIFENWYEIDSKNIDCLKILSGINNVIGNDEISKNYQAKIYDLESN
jgi:tetratricopeptide (TPR) repeat protein